MEWFNRLLNRKQLVQVNGVKSSTRSVVCGFPKGLIQSPLLFILCINDLTGHLMDARFNLYADHTTLYYYSASLVELMIILHIEMAIVGE